jgi:hypothetical protein
MSMPHEPMSELEKTIYGMKLELLQGAIDKMMAEAMQKFADDFAKKVVERLKQQGVC